VPAIIIFLSATPALGTFPRNQTSADDARLNGATTYSWIGGDEQDIDHRRTPIDNQR
jgi:hypothetical protein